MIFKAILAGFLLALTPLGLPAEDFVRPYNGHGYLFWGPGAAPGGGSMQQLGGGGEAFIYKGLAAGAELGYMYPSETFVYGLGMFSTNGSYHLNRNRNAKLLPFVTGGYTLAFRGGHENLFNFGGGLTWWMADHVGLRVELRDYVWMCCRTEHSPQVRFGLTLR